MTFTTTPRRLAKTFALVAGMSVLSMHAFAGGDAALYGPTAPKGSTFVRIYNASNAGSQRHRRQHQPERCRTAVQQ